MISPSKGEKASLISSQHTHDYVSNDDGPAQAHPSVPDPLSEESAVAVTIPESPSKAVSSEEKEDAPPPTVTAKLLIRIMIPLFLVVASALIVVAIELSRDGSLSGFTKSFFRSFLVILVMEIGDRTFIVAALMSLKNSKVVVFCAAYSALVLMTVISAFIGYATTSLLFLPDSVTHYAAAALFTLFGLQMLYASKDMSDEVTGELEDVKEELKEKEKEGHEPARCWAWIPCLGPVFVQVFMLTAISEIGDRSQFATIAMAADMNVYGVALGGCLGHGTTTMAAVLGGDLIASRISERKITIVGGVVFLIFALIDFFESPSRDSGDDYLPQWMLSPAEQEANLDMSDTDVAGMIDTDSDILS